MSASCFVGEVPGQMVIFPLPTSRGRQYGMEAGYYSAGRLATDSLGNLTLTLTNVVVGSRVRVEEEVSGATIYDAAAAASTVVITVPVYSAGSPSNDLRIKVRKASSGTTYKPYETLATALIGAQSIYVSQIPDE